MVDKFECLWVGQERVSQAKTGGATENRTVSLFVVDAVTTIADNQWFQRLKP